MLQNEYASRNVDGIENKNEIMKEGATDPPRAKHMLCRLCRLPKIAGSNQVWPNGLRGCKCDELSPFYNSNLPNTNWDSHGLVSPPRPKKLHHVQLPETNVNESLDSPKNKTCFAKAEPLKERSFEPPQGMETGQYPRPLFHQYYPNRREVYTFDLLPLPFMDKLKYQEMRALSMDNEDVQEKWKDFLYKLPNSVSELTAYPDDKLWRWNKYLRYTPDNRNEFRYKMQAGPKYDDVGRLPITGENLQIFRTIKTKPKTNLKYTLKKGDGTRKQ